MNNKMLIVVRGGGDLATGIVHRLYKAGYQTVILETDSPSSIRRQVCFSEAVYDGISEVEGVKAVRIDSIDDIHEVLSEGNVPVLVDGDGKSIAELKPDVVVDAIIAKKNIGTTIDMANLVVGVGPGFVAGNDVHIVIETMRGHNLGRVILNGSAAPNTGIPGNIAGYTLERVIHSECAGVFRNVSRIGAVVNKGQEIARIYDESEQSYTSVTATISGVLRGLLRDKMVVPCGFKVADIDPRIEELDNCFTISDKARSIGGSVLEVISAYANEKLY